MPKNYLIYIKLWLLIQIIIEINCQTSPYVHKRRKGHGATLIDNKLYILGGDNNGKDFFYIDFFAPFNTQNLSIKDLSSINTIPKHLNAMSVKGGANNIILFVFGGGADAIHTFNPLNNLWIIPKITGQSLLALLGSSTGTIDYNGIMYFLDGYSSNIVILDTINLIWKEGNPIVVSKGYGSTSVLLPDNKIIYMGVNNNWSTKITSGTVPPTRYGLSAVLGLDGQRVIIFGGFENDVTSFLSSKNPLYELSLINFEWRIPKTSGQTPSYRAFHRANVIMNYMVITFGYFYQTENDVLLLRISNHDEYIWTNEFNPSSNIVMPSTPSTSPSALPTIPSLQQSNSDMKFTFGIIFGTLLGLFLFIFLVCLWTCRKRNDNKNQDKKNVHNQVPLGNENIYNHGREIIEESSSNEHVHNHGQEIIELPDNERIFNHGQEIVQLHTSDPIINNSYNHGQELIQNVNDKTFSQQYVQELEQEIKYLRDVINNKESTK
ncbi:hypothetical protein GLOIN_2v1780026 [Rhizophagus clarus]|uniref:Galactose oxidase n=1 Tax=Rhizophagus clarus TaxID=94130 RepID=A0A8H3MEX9_9GLOM|nr:hypothetical protein GLOIN_2v1780026 [Rhizophagus clarus]